MINANIKSVIFAKWAYDGSIFVNEQIKNILVWIRKANSSLWDGLEIHSLKLLIINLSIMFEFLGEHLTPNFGMITCKTTFSRIDIIW